MSFLSCGAVVAMACQRSVVVVADVAGPHLVPFSLSGRGVTILRSSSPVRCRSDLANCLLYLLFCVSFDGERCFYQNTQIRTEDAIVGGCVCKILFFFPRRLAF